MNSGLYKKVAYNTVYQLAAKFVSMCITVLVTVIVAHYYGKSAYGEFSLMQNWPALFFVIVDFGLNAVAVRELSKDWSKSGKVFGNILIFRTLLSLVFIFGLILVIIFFPYTPGLKIGIAFSLLLIYTQALYATGNIFFQIKMRYDLSSISYLGGYILIFLLILVCVWFKLPVGFVSFCYVIGGFLTFLLNLKYLRVLGVRIELTPDIGMMKHLLKESLPLGLMFVFSQINFKADSILISAIPIPESFNMTNTEAVATYSLPYKIFEVALVIPTFFMNSAYPVMIKNAVQGQTVLKKNLKNILFAMFVTAVISGVSLLVSAPVIISILGGNEFTNSVIVLRILSAGLVIYFLTQPLSWLIVTLEKQGYLPYIYAVGAVINLTLNLFFIPRYAYLASALITHLSELVILILLVIAARRAWKHKYA